MSPLPDDPRVIVQSPDETKKFFDDERNVHFMGILNSSDPAFNAMIQFVENTFYVPGTPRNDLFNLRLCLPFENGPCFGIVSIPISERGNIEDHIDNFGLTKMAGVPKQIISHGGVYTFPFPTEPKRFYSLIGKSENVIR